MRKTEPMSVALRKDSPSIAVDMPGDGRASAHFTDNGDAVVRLQNKSGALVMRLSFDAAEPAGAKPAKSAASGSKPKAKRGRKPMSRTERRARALRDLKARLAKGARIPIASVLARAWKVDASTAQSWMHAWERDGVIPKRKRVGRRLQFPPPRSNSLNGTAAVH